VRLAFTIPGPPVPKARARVVSHVDKAGKRKTRGITPKRTERYEDLVKLHALGARLRIENSARRAGLASGLDPATVELFQARWPHSDKAARFGLVVRVYFFEHEGDWDNYGKIVSDACQGVLWANDRQISDGRCVKTKVARGQERIEIEAWPIEVDSCANTR
jgi:hypothetical protein